MPKWSEKRCENKGILRFLASRRYPRSRAGMLRTLNSSTHMVILRTWSRTRCPKDRACSAKETRILKSLGVRANCREWEHAFPPIAFETMSSWKERC